MSAEKIIAWIIVAVATMGLIVLGVRFPSVGVALVFVFGAAALIWAVEVLTRGKVR